jgi:aspartyl-tRNA(Asn)/glutamyl-tRNA(Gln) amidotransferase subunit A
MTMTKTMAKPLHELSIAEAGRALRAGTVSSVALTQHALARVASLDPLLHSFVLVTKERALADAERADRELKSGIDKGPLHGVPYALKDIYNTAGIPRPAIPSCCSITCRPRTAWSRQS